VRGISYFGYPRCAYKPASGMYSLEVALKQTFDKIKKAAK
jgi:hypothetical protein